VTGGFLAVKVDREEGQPTATFTHYSVKGEVLNEDKIIGWPLIRSMGGYALDQRVICISKEKYRIACIKQTNKSYDVDKKGNLLDDCQGENGSIRYRFFDSRLDVLRNMHRIYDLYVYPAAIILRRTYHHLAVTNKSDTAEMKMIRDLLLYIQYHQCVFTRQKILYNSFDC